MATPRTSLSPIRAQYNPYKEKNDLQRSINTALQDMNIANTVITGLQEAYTGLFTDFESKNEFPSVTREQIYVAIIIYNKANNGLPPSINELISHINAHCKQLMDFSDIKDIENYYTEFCTMDWITSTDGKTYNIAKIHKDMQIIKPITYVPWNIYAVQEKIQILINSIDKEIDDLIKTHENPFQQKHSLYESISNQVFHLLETLTSYTAIIDEETISKYEKQLKQILHKIKYAEYYKILIYVLNESVKQAIFHIKDKVIRIITEFISSDTLTIQSNYDSMLARHLEIIVLYSLKFVSTKKKEELYFNLITAMIEHDICPQEPIPKIHISKIIKIIKLLYYKVEQNIHLKPNILLIAQVKFANSLITHYTQNHEEINNATVSTKIIIIITDLFKKYNKLLQNDSIDFHYIEISIKECYSLLNILKNLTTKSSIRMLKLLETTICRRIIRELNNILIINQHTISILMDISSTLTKLELITDLYNITAVKFLELISMKLKMEVCENNRSEICLLIVQVLKCEIIIPKNMHKNIERIIDFLFPEYAQFILRHFITEEKIKYVSDYVLKINYRDIIYTRRTKFLDLLSREKIRIIIEEANKRGLFITSEMPPLNINLSLYNENLTGRAYQVHKYRDIIIHLRELVIRIVTISQVNVINEAMPHQDIFNHLTNEINRLLPISTNEKQNILTNAALARIYQLRNTPSGSQFFEDMPYLLELIKYDLGWREGFESYDSRMLNLLRSLSDSTEAYGDITNFNENINANMSCPEGIFERVYLCLQNLSESFSLLFYVKATSQTCAQVYNMLTRCLAEEEFKQNVVKNTRLINHQGVITINVITKSIIITIISIEQERMKELIHNYREISLDSSTGAVETKLINLVETAIEIAKEFWNGTAKYQLRNHLKTNLNTMSEAYEENKEDEDPFHFLEIISLTKIAN